MRFWIGDRVERDKGCDCLGAPPSNSQLQSAQPHLQSTDDQARHGVVPPQATLLIETLVEVAMGTFGRTQHRISADDADQPFQVAGSSRAEGRCGKGKRNSHHPEHNWLREGGVARERKRHRHSER